MLLPGEVVQKRSEGLRRAPRRGDPGSGGVLPACGSAAEPPRDFHYCAGSELGLFNVNGEHGAARLRPTSARWVISS